ncbi:hypothetical protein RQP46_000109 [Phenoliferia psychrophenolica]
MDLSPLVSLARTLLAFKSTILPASKESESSAEEVNGKPTVVDCRPIVQSLRVRSGSRSYEEYCRQVTAKQPPHQWRLGVDNSPMPPCQCLECQEAAAQPKTGPAWRNRPTYLQQRAQERADEDAKAAAKLNRA